jgi:hypothetical protein
MKTLKKYVMKLWTAFFNAYKECMTIYGESMMRGGSYGC